MLPVLRSSSGSGHRPLTAKIAGSNPVRSTKLPGFADFKHHLLNMMITCSLVEDYIASLLETKLRDVQALHVHIKAITPGKKLSFLNGENDAGKIVSNPNIGYGF